MRVAIATVLILLAGEANAQSWRAIDGDTIVLDGETIRIANIDTPEIRHAQCDAERRLGLVAKAELEKLLDSGAITLERGDPASGRLKDKYGRTLGIISIDGLDVGETLIGRQLARPWTGKRKAWCE